MTMFKAIALAGALLITPAAADGPPVFRFYPKSIKDAGHEIGPNGIPEVRSVQARLHELGYKVRIDGLPGPATDKALRDYQRDHDLEPTGDLDGKTWARLWSMNAPPVDLKNNCTDC